MEASADAIAYAKSKGVRLYQAQVAEGVDLERIKAYGFSGARGSLFTQYALHWQ